jgi:hypothetical protein
MMPIPLQGPHQGAQKSTKAGLSACNTSASKPLSSISNTFCAIVPLSFHQSALILILKVDLIQIIPNL